MTVLSLSSLNQGIAPSATPTTPPAPVAKYQGVSSADALASETNTQTQPSKLSQIGSGLKNTFEQGATNVKNDITNISGEAAKAGNSPLAKIAAVGQGAGNIAGDVAGTAGGILGSILSPFLPDSVKSGISDATKYVSDKVNSIPGMTPEIAKSLGGLFSTATLEGGSEAEAPVASAAKDAAGTVADKASEVANKVEGALKTSEPTAEQSQIQLSEQARKSVTPNYDKSMIGEKITDSDGKSVDRVNEPSSASQGITAANKARTINLSGNEKAAADELSKTPGFQQLTKENPKATALEKFNALQPDIADKAEKLTADLKAEDAGDEANGIKKPITKQKMVARATSAIQDAAEKYAGLKKTAPEVKNYIRSLVKNSENVAENRVGAQELYKNMDDMYQANGGKYVGNKTLDIFHSASQNAIKDLIDENTKSVAVRDSLTSQHKLYQASDLLKANAQDEAPTRFGRAEQKSPLLKAAVQTAKRLPQRFIAGGILQGVREGIKGIKP